MFIVFARKKCKVICETDDLIWSKPSDWSVIYEWKWLNFVSADISGGETCDETLSTSVWEVMEYYCSLIFPGHNKYQLSERTAS